MAATCAKVLAVAELLENILLALPMKDILLSQGVCNFWKQVIAGSPRLQQAFFVRTDGRVISSTPRAIGEMAEMRRITLYRNPVFMPLLASFFPSYNYADDSKFWDHLGTAWECPTASWRSMLLTRPPLLELRIEVWVRNPSEHVSEVVSAIVRQEKGVTAQDLIDCVKNQFDQVIQSVLGAEATTASYSLRDYCFWRVPIKTWEELESLGVVVASSDGGRHG